MANSTLTDLITVKTDATYSWQQLVSMQARADDLIAQKLRRGWVSGIDSADNTVRIDIPRNRSDVVADLQPLGQEYRGAFDVEQTEPAI